MKSKQTLSLFAIAMLVYSGWRVFDYMGSNLAGVDDTVRFIISVAFLAFSEVGLLIWLHIGAPHATTDLQEGVATFLIWANFAGSMIIGLADMLKHNTVYQVDLSALDPVLFIAPWIMVVLNLGGYLLYMQADSESMLDREERRLRHEETRVELEARRAAIRELRANQAGLAEKLAPHYIADITNRVNGRTLKRFTRQANQLPSGNGKVVYNQESDLAGVELSDPKNVKGGAR